MNIPVELSAAGTQPLRIAQVTGHLERGGIESWLLNVAGLLPADIQMDVLVATAPSRPGSLAGDFQARSVDVRLLPSTARLLPFSLALYRLLRQQEYDVVHSHIHHFGGLVLLMARLAGVPVRIATSHSDTRRGDRQAGRLRAAYLTFMRWALQAGSTHRLAVAPEAAEALYGPSWAAQGTRLVTLGVNLEAVRQPGDLALVRQEFGLTGAEPVLGHVGQLRPEKNHLFLLDVFAAYLHRHGPAHLLLVGDGPVRPAVEARAQELGLASRVHITGSRADVGRLLAMMDVFVFPSLFEGLGLALVEARTSGLPAVVSTGVHIDPRMGHMTAVDLAAGPVVWADAAHRALQDGRQESGGDAFDVRVHTAELMHFYHTARQAVPRRRAQP